MFRRVRRDLFRNNSAGGTPVVECGGVRFTRRNWASFRLWGNLSPSQLSKFLEGLDYPLCSPIGCWVIWSTSRATDAIFLQAVCENCGCELGAIIRYRLFRKAVTGKQHAQHISVFSVVVLYIGSTVSSLPPIRRFSWIPAL